MDRRDGARPDLPWSLDLYASIGVPVERTILGLPLYGMRWRVEGPEIGAPRLGDGAIWVPADNPKFLADPPAPPELDPIEIVEFYAVAPTVSPVPGDSRATAGWQAIYVDSPADPRRRSSRSPTSAAWPAPGSGRSATSAGSPGYSELIDRRSPRESSTVGQADRRRLAGERAEADDGDRRDASGQQQREPARGDDDIDRGRDRARPDRRVQRCQQDPDDGGVRPGQRPPERRPTPRSQSQNGSAAEDQQERRQEDRRRARSSRRGRRSGIGADTAPRYPANVKSGPGTAWAAP